MPLLNENISIKIKDISFMAWDTSSVSVAARPWHALVFRLHGSASFFDGKKNIDTHTGDVFYMPANRKYHAVYHEKNEIIVIHFESDIISDMENYCLNNQDSVLLLFKRIYDTWNKKTEVYYYSSLALMCEILKTIEYQQGSGFKDKTIEAFENAVEYMENNYTNCDFSVEEMVKRAFMSNTYFRKLFFAKFGVTPVKYLMSKRLSLAEKLLSTGKYSIKETAEMSGFGDVKYFSRMVKKNYGIPPSRLYRQWSRTVPLTPLTSP